MEYDGIYIYMWYSVKGYNPIDGMDIFRQQMPKIWFGLVQTPALHGQLGMIQHQVTEGDDWDKASCVKALPKSLQLWPWLLPITGYFNGIIHSINGVSSVFITY